MTQEKNIQGSKILIVDDVETNIHLLMEILSSDYIVSVALDGKSAIELTKKNHPDLILLDVIMPGLSGFDVCQQLQSNPLTADIPILFLTASSDRESIETAFKLGAVDFISKPFDIPEVQARVSTHLSLKKARDLLSHQAEILEEKVIERTAEIALTQEVTIDSLATLAEIRDPETGHHIQRTKHYVKILAEEIMKLPKYHEVIDSSMIDLLFKSAALHDIGKVGIQDAILLKPGKLTNDEYRIMQEHAAYGGTVLERAEEKIGKNSFLSLAREIAYTHHERWDGNGYPSKLKENEIPISGRLMALADVYDALTNKRVYKPAYSHDEAKRIIKEQRGKHFDPDIVDAFLNSEMKFIEIHQQYHEE